MDGMESDLVLEVLDTPDRLPSSSNCQLEPTRRLYTHRCREFSSSCSKPSHVSMPDDTEMLFKQARLARKISEPSSRTQGTSHDLEQNGIPNESRVTTETIELNSDGKHTRRRIGKDLFNKVQSGESRRSSGFLAEGSSHPTKLVSQSGTVICLKPPANVSKAERADAADVDNTGSKFRDKGKGVDQSSMQPRTEQAETSPLKLDAPQSNTRQRKLVRNGCISPLNIAKNNSLQGNNVSQELQSSSPSHPVQIVSPDLDGSCVDRKKKKVIVGYNGVAGGPHTTARLQSGRLCSTPGKEVTVISDIDGDSINVVHDSPEITTSQPGPSISSVVASSESGSECIREVLPKGKRKYSTTHSQSAECSTSSFGDAEISNLRSSNQSSNSNLTNSRRSQRRSTLLGPIIEVDELRSPEKLHCNPQEQSSRGSDVYNVSSIQVESDELLARQLQEQLYNEPPMIRGTEEIDATIAWSFQQEEDARRSAARQNHSRHRDATVAQSHARPGDNPGPSTNRARRSTSARMAQLRRGFRPPMHRAQRLDFLEAMEAAFDISSSTGIPNRILQVQRDFNENDYEMLLALDENNQHTGASERQINSLPQLIIETDNIQEACAVCLEPPITGDTIRHLPCLHKFHKECIDNWLRRKRSCPICKSGIT